MADRKAAMGKLAGQLGIGWSDNLLMPSWNGAKMEQVYPWGTIRTPTTEVNIATMNELNAGQKNVIKEITSVMLPQFGYEKMT